MVIRSEVMAQRYGVDWNFSTGSRCRARNRLGDRCGRAAIRGGAVCYMHGGAAPQVRGAAQRRIEDLVPAAVRSLEELLSPETKPEVRLRAARHVLRLAGIKPEAPLVLTSDHEGEADAEIDALVEQLRALRSS